MDAPSFDPYASYSDNSAPQTPESRHTDMHFNYKANADDAVRNIFADHNPDEPHVEVHPVQDAPYWTPQSAPLTNNFFNNNGSRGSLLQELYEEQQPANSDVYPDHSVSDNWSFNHNQQQQIPHSQQPLSTRPHDYQMMRRNTFPAVRYDREDGLPVQQYPPFMPQQTHFQRPESLGYSDQMPLSNEPAPLQSENFMSTHSTYHDIHDPANIKLEESASMIVPSHPFYRPPSSGGVPPMGMPYMSPQHGLHVQHTDDAASKETQYLRRRCFNCHTTEPPSWRRSTLNPGKIVCNKCGLYERTHLRPRPLRFDELRAGNKQRKQSKGTVSPKAKMASIVKKEPREFGLVRRSSVSSSSSVHSGSGASDWDDNVSVYSSGSAPPTSFNSPNVQTFPLSRDSQSPPRDGGIRLPNAPLSDIASLQQQQPLTSQPSTPSLPPPTPRKAHTSPGYFSPPMSEASPAAADVQPQVQQDYFHRASQEAPAGVSGSWGDLSLKDGPNATLLASPVPTPVAS